MRWEFVALAAGLLLVLGLQHWRQRAAAAAARREMYEECLPVIKLAQIEQHGTQFPSLTGVYRGKRIRLDAIVDSASLRKLPSLWLQLNIIEPLPIEATLDLLVRPLNTEFFSPSAGLPLRLTMPSGWPEHAIIKADRENAAKLLPRVDVLVRSVFADLRCKELLITPKGARLVIQLAQADRADYLVLRAMVFDQTRVPPKLFVRLMDQLVQLHDDLRGVRPSIAAAPLQHS
jgi:hypothetical protein